MGRKKKQRRHQLPPLAKPPTIQILLKRAFELKKRLDDNPGLTRAGLARETKICPSFLTRILNLLNLAPEIRAQILKMPLTIYAEPISERRIQFIARMKNPELQIGEFNKLANQKPRARLPLRQPHRPNLLLHADHQITLV